MDTSIYVPLYNKIKTLGIMLFEAEQKILQLEHELEVKDKIIKDLNVDIYFSDLEVKEMKQIIDQSENVENLFSLQQQVDELTSANNVLSFEITM